MIPALCGLVAFQIGSHIFSQASLDFHPSIYASSGAGMTGVLNSGQWL
jgi:hypothetical protein